MVVNSTNREFERLKHFFMQKITRAVAGLEILDAKVNKKEK